MLSSRVCWQLLLGWALLLGQPVFGDLDAAEEPPLAESEELEPVSQDPEEPVPESQEPEEPVPESQEPEEPVPESQEQEEPEPLSGESQEMMGRPFTFEELEQILGPSDEKLETHAEEGRQRLERHRDHPFDYPIQYLKQVALQHYNQKSSHIYTLYENGNVKIKKAIGTTIYIKLLLVKTSCTKEEGKALIRQLFHYEEDEMEPSPLSAERIRCEVPPASEQEIEDCTFTLFRDARSAYSREYTVTGSSCVPFDKWHEIDQ